MGDDVVELPPTVVHLQQVRLEQASIGDSTLVARGFAIIDLALGEIESDQFGRRQSNSHGQEIAALSAAKLEDTSPRRRCRICTEQASDCSQMVRVTLRKSQPWIREFVVRGSFGHDDRGRNSVRLEKVLEMGRKASKELVTGDKEDGYQCPRHQCLPVKRVVSG